MSKRPYSSSTELRLWTPEKKRESSSSRRLGISTVSSSSNSISFTRPADWSRGTTDKYYHESGTVRKFRSLALVYGKSYVSKHQVTIDQSKPFELPDAWFIKRSIRRSGHSMGKVDKYYCERSTGRVFRSLVDVQRYLADNYIEENAYVSKLFRSARLIQTSESEETDGDNTSGSAIKPRSSDNESYSDHSEDVLLKDLVIKCDDVPPKHIVRNADEVPLKDLVRKSSDVPLKNFVRISNGKDLVQGADDMSPNGSAQKVVDVPPKEPVRKPNDEPLKELVRKLPTARKTSKQTHNLATPSANVFSCAATVSNNPIKIKWVLNGPAGDDWGPFIGDTMVPESLKLEWAKLFTYIVSQNYPNGSSLDALVS